MFLWHITESQQTKAAKESASYVPKYHKQIIHCPKGMSRAEQSNRLTRGTSCRFWDSVSETILATHFH